MGTIFAFYINNIDHFLVSITTPYNIFNLFPLINPVIIILMMVSIILIFIEFFAYIL